MVANVKECLSQPIYGHSSNNPPAFRRATPATGPPVYFLEDEEIDFEKMLKEEQLPAPKNVRWAAHWLAIEGVQPLIPENPPSAPSLAQNGQFSQAPQPSALPTPPSTQAGSSTATAPKPTKPPLIKTQISRELQLYYTRLTSSLLPGADDHRAPDDRRKNAALSSLRADAGLQQLLPYLVSWVGEGVVNALRRDGEIELVDVDRARIEVMMEVIAALLDNERLFVEPYLHQLLPPILSVLLTSSLSISHPFSHISLPTPTHLRKHASSLLSRLLSLHSATYPSLAPRVTKTLLAALLDPGRTLGTREGAVRGLIGVGREAVKRGLIAGGGGKVIGYEIQRARESGEDIQGAEDAIMSALLLLHPHQPNPIPPPPLNDMDDEDLVAKERLKEGFGDYLALNIAEDGAWAKGLLLVFGEGSGSVGSGGEQQQQ